MLTNPVSRVFIILAILAAALFTINFSNRSNASQAELSRHPRLVILVFPGSTYLSDFHQRHSDWTLQITTANIPVTGAEELSDYHERHPEQRMSAETQPVDLSDYFLRH